MNQNSVVVKLLDLVGTDRPFGNIEGRQTLQKLIGYIEQIRGVRTIGVSLDGIQATDASFPRESVVSLAKQLRGEKGFYLTDLSDPDIIDNWSYAARAKDQPLVIWRERDEFEIIGPEINEATRTLVEHVLRKGSVLASQVAADLNLSVPNASTRLKNLVKQGYLMRTEDAAASGGIEFKYEAIGPSR